MLAQRLAALAGTGNRSSYYNTVQEFPPFCVLSISAKVVNWTKGAPFPRDSMAGPYGPIPIDKTLKRAPKWYERHLFIWPAGFLAAVGFMTLLEM